MHIFRITCCVSLFVNFNYSKSVATWFNSCKNIVISKTIICSPCIFYTIILVCVFKSFPTNYFWVLNLLVLLNSTLLFCLFRLLAKTVLSGFFCYWFFGVGCLFCRFLSLHNFTIFYIKFFCRFWRNLYRGFRFFSFLFCMFLFGLLFLFYLSCFCKNIRRRSKPIINILFVKTHSCKEVSCLFCNLSFFSDRIFVFSKSY
jgi:hypothetical protein